MWNILLKIKHKHLKREKFPRIIIPVVLSLVRALKMRLFTVCASLPARDPKMLVSMFPNTSSDAENFREDWKTIFLTGRISIWIQTSPYRRQTERQIKKWTLWTLRENGLWRKESVSWAVIAKWYQEWGNGQPPRSEREDWESLHRMPFMGIVQVPAEVRKEKAFLDKFGTTDLLTLE